MKYNCFFMSWALMLILSLKCMATDQVYLDDYERFKQPTARVVYAGLEGLEAKVDKLYKELAEQLISHTKKLDATIVAEDNEHQEIRRKLASLQAQASTQISLSGELDKAHQEFKKTQAEQASDLIKLKEKFLEELKKLKDQHEKDLQKKAAVDLQAEVDRHATRLSDAEDHIKDHATKIKQLQTGQKDIVAVLDKKFIEQKRVLDAQQIQLESHNQQIQTIQSELAVLATIEKKQLQIEFALKAVTDGQKKLEDEAATKQDAVELRTQQAIQQLELSEFEKKLKKLKGQLAQAESDIQKRTSAVDLQAMVKEWEKELLEQTSSLWQETSEKLKAAVEVIDKKTQELHHSHKSISQDLELKLTQLTDRVTILEGQPTTHLIAPLQEEQETPEEGDGHGGDDNGQESDADEEGLVKKTDTMELLDKRLTALEGVVAQYSSTTPKNNATAHNNTATTLSQTEDDEKEGIETRIEKLEQQIDALKKNLRPTEENSLSPQKQLVISSKKNQQNCCERYSWAFHIPVYLGAAYFLIIWTANEYLRVRVYAI